MSYACPHCKGSRAVIQAPIVRFLKGKRRPKTEIVGYLAKCFSCMGLFEVDKRGARFDGVPKAAKAAPGAAPDIPARDHDEVQATGAALRARGPLVPRERPSY